MTVSATYIIFGGNFSQFQPQNWGPIGIYYRRMKNHKNGHSYTNAKSLFVILKLCNVACRTKKGIMTPNNQNQQCSIVISKLSSRFQWWYQVLPGTMDIHWLFPCWPSSNSSSKPMVLCGAFHRIMYPFLKDFRLNDCQHTSGHPTKHPTISPCSNQLLTQPLAATLAIYQQLCWKGGQMYHVNRPTLFCYATVNLMMVIMSYNVVQVSAGVDDYISGWWLQP